MSLLLVVAIGQSALAEDELTSLEKASVCKPRLWGRITEQRRLAGWAWFAETNGTEGLPDYIS
ncbi:MAG TPA: hypothetical protein VFP10_07600, partial [Candidatus Eisenbacteria bacterium]|nr:hypothetical protein [Candidatus Eisenbacteria bacterium]